ncbi:MAG TPA: hypothetical protein DEQ34_08310 [Balneolaceae bacterium]|nr:hypothetical protein [Balneolaceae bacterium]|tara:strand:- start:109041 stop:109634 length:594 start_codon:yes stop_codon:yes gene_type:complete
MKRFLFGLFLVMLYSGCGTTFTMTNEVRYGDEISFADNDPILISSNAWFSEELTEDYTNNKYVGKTGDKLLQQVLIGYADQLPGLKYDSPGNADIIFKVKKVTVDRFWLTADIMYSGLFYKIKMEADILLEGKVIHSVSLKERVNGALFLFEEDHAHYRMSREEKGNQEYQKQIFEHGLRQLFQQLYFEYLDIKLQK